MKNILKSRGLLTVSILMVLFGVAEVARNNIKESPEESGLSLMFWKKTKGRI
jgi:hypothetical protein